ncbi:unnamed protein product [Larinioides sclopetarius]|uniref:C2H2-type domain-containing protein n=1 Tax=Larinioides sclopetarius TaxID=280406 RepID=A0AAV2B5C7_9ARAC
MYLNHGAVFLSNGKWKTSFLLQNKIQIHRFHCSQCSYSSDRKYHLLRHQLIHSGERPYKCTFCGKGFTTKQNCETHKMTHRQDQIHCCSICSQQFSSSRALQRHISTHLL